VERVWCSSNHKLQTPVLEHHPNSLAYIQRRGSNVKLVVLTSPLWHQNIAGLKLSWVQGYFYKNVFWIFIAVWLKVKPLFVGSTWCSGKHAPFYYST
jgi:hypothetical protein